jgi:hypothetical protein
LLGFLGCSAGASAATFASTGFSVGDFIVVKMGWVLKITSSTLGLLTVSRIARYGEISQNGNSEIGNHADRKNGEIATAHVNDKANYDRENAQ